MTVENTTEEVISEEIIIEQIYPGVSDRVKSIIFDGIIMFVFMVIATFAFSMFENVIDLAKIITFIFIFFLYDPIFTSVFGGTIGHMMNGLRVKRENNQTKNIIFPLAIIRFIFKALLGWISLLTVSGNEKRKAIHDFIVGSVVVYYKK